MTTEEEMKNAAREFSRARKTDIGVIVALLINVVTAAFGVGVYFNTIVEQGKDIADLQRDRLEDRRAIAQLSETLVRIDANVQFLKERADEDRVWLYGARK